MLNKITWKHSQLLLFFNNKVINKEEKFFF